MKRNLVWFLHKILHASWLNQEMYLRCIFIKHRFIFKSLPLVSLFFAPCVQIKVFNGFCMKHTFSCLLLFFVSLTPASASSFSWMSTTIELVIIFIFISSLSSLHAPSLHGILSCPFSGQFIVLLPVCLVDSSDFRDKRIIRVGITQKGTDRQQDLRYR